MSARPIRRSQIRHGEGVSRLSWSTRRGPPAIFNLDVRELRKHAHHQLAQAKYTPRDHAQERIEPWNWLKCDSEVCCPSSVLSVKDSNLSTPRIWDAAA
ncbi:hypothetical protein AMJ96_PD00571 (plasmid) [Rhizobium sp. N113]|nr:hypothetical protein AMJ98_PE00564 [Rhizobium sp. N1341]ANL25772.1 hypothetical protein AMJ96_PD00571 [Rhizobium sp. N113]